jgi:hypothetical protein
MKLIKLLTFWAISVVLFLFKNISKSDTVYTVKENVYLVELNQ